MAGCSCPTLASAALRPNSSKPAGHDSGQFQTQGCLWWTLDKTKTTASFATKIDPSLSWGVGDLPAIWHTAGQCWSSPNAGRCSRGTPKSCSQVPAGQTTSTSRVKFILKGPNSTTMIGPLPSWVCCGASLCLAILWVVSFVLFYTDAPEEHQNTAQNG